MRWWNSCLRGLKRAFVCRRGGVRAVWKLLLAYAVYVLWAWAATYLLSLGFGELFAAWNLNANTLSRAPAWARTLAAHYGRVISLVSSAGTVALSCGLLHWFAREQTERPRARDFGLGALAGLGAVGLGAGLFVLLDSMRAYEAGFAVNGDMAWMLPVYLLAALAEESFARALVMRTVARSAGPCWAYAASAAALLLITGSYALAPLGIVNMLLFALVCARLSATGRSGAAIGLRFAWSFGANALIAFPGGSTGAQAGARLYAVSEAWLTGGESGLICGAWMTLVLLALGVWLYRPRPRRKKTARAVPARKK